MATKYAQVKEALINLEIGQSLEKVDLVISIWGRCDYFVSRSFDVYLSKVKKELALDRLRYETHINQVVLRLENDGDSCNDKGGNCNYPHCTASDCDEDYKTTDKTVKL